MADKLPWFPFYASDWVTDPRVLSLSNEQRGIFHWLLCRQWMDGDLPGDVMAVYPLLPPGSDSAAVAFVLTAFFPADPDTTRRSNPRLNDIRAEQESFVESRRDGARKTNEIKRLKRHAERPLSDTLSARKTKTEPEPKASSATAPADLLAWIPEGYHPDLTARLRASHSPDGLIAELRLLRQEPEARGLKGVTGDHVGQALRDSAMKSIKLTGKSLANCVRVAQSSNGHQKAEAKPDSAPAWFTPAPRL